MIAKIYYKIRCWLGFHPWTYNGAMNNTTSMRQCRECWTIEKPRTKNSRYVGWKRNVNGW